MARGAGVGEGAASPMAAAIAWVLRDGFGMFGSLVFSYVFGRGFDRDVKERRRIVAPRSVAALSPTLATSSRPQEWRLFADLINDVGLTLDMLAPLTLSSTSFAMGARTWHIAQWWACFPPRAAYCFMELYLITAFGASRRQKTRCTSPMSLSVS